MDHDKIDNDPTPPTIKFAIGKLVATPGAREALKRNGQYFSELLAMHMAGQWGDVPAEDARLNDAGVSNEDDPDLRTRVLSAYVLKDGTRVWFITEADRSSTCALLPEEY